jgi:hypothetical protein
MAKVLALTFVDCNGELHRLSYNIYDSDLAQRWVQLTKQNQADPEKYIHTSFTNISYNQISSVREKLTDCLNRINSVYDAPLPLYEELAELSTPELNYLHEEFEQYGDRSEELMVSTKWWSNQLHEDFLLLNELIHLHEDLLFVKTDPFPNMAVLYDYYPQGLHMPILERDKLWLNPLKKWGELCLGYNTLGKDWMKVVHDNDLEVIERDQVRPQERFAAEAWLNFGPDSNETWEFRKIEKWYLALPKRLQDKVPINDLNKLTLGRFKIGKLHVDQEFVDRYGGDLNEYLHINTSKSKKDWNENVFSTFVTLKKVQFYD